ncbi:MAG TPA: hypothetical protein VID94_06540, partial [Acidimicrobiales bacterium]
MTGRPWRKPLAAAVLLAVGVWLTPTPPTVLGSDGPCPGSTGVTVVVDFQVLGGGVLTRCAPGAPVSGFDALKGAGFSIAEVQNVPGFLCRIDGKPTVAQDRCVNTPPASAYWSYWHAPRGGAWVTSQEGGKTRKPPIGSVDGWSFSDDGSPGAASPPGIAPPKPPATPKPATPKPTPIPVTQKPATPRPSSGSTATPDASVAETPTATPTPSDLASVESTSSAALAEEPTPSVDTESLADATTDAAGSYAAVASANDPPLGTLLGIGLVVIV